MPFLLIDPRQFVASLAQGVEYLVELRMNGLGHDVQHVV
jgi:hypothetical protein